MTPGPTEVPPRVREAISRPIQNPDVDEKFREFYHELEEKLKKIYRTTDDVLILGGEGILGLEASVASVVDKGDKVLCISNGIYGDGFADFVEMYGGEPITCRSSYRRGLDLENVKSLLDEYDFEASTMVHCETPTGTLNDIAEILSILKEEGILTIVDAVSSLGGTSVPVEDIDLCIGGSQKCFSAPPGLTFLSVSEDAWGTMMKKEQRTFYANLALWKETWLEEDYFPYTHLVSNLYALDEALDMILKEGLEDVFRRHEEVSDRCRRMGFEIGLELYPKEERLSSPTVTAFRVGGRAVELQRKVYGDHDILLGTGLQDLEDDILRVGHMGYNADMEKVERTMDALRDTVSELS